MNKLWPTVTVDNPCPICGKPDWCAIGDRSIKCMREPSQHPAKDGGWYHFLEQSGKAVKVRIAQQNQREQNVLSAINWESLWLSFVGGSNESILQFGIRLGVTFNSLCALQCLWSTENKSWAFPMRDGKNEMVGIRLRNEEGKKWAIKGSRQGLFIPQRIEAKSPCLITEGPTDCAAALTLGYFAIGRANCHNGAGELRIALKRLKVSRIVIVADNDSKHKRTGEEWEPGIEGAQRLAKELKMPHVIWVTPTKDLREFVKMGGTKQLADSMINNLIWKK
jgi:hypothetical protein